MNTKKTWHRLLVMFAIACAGFIALALFAEENRASAAEKAALPPEQAFEKLEFNSLELRGFLSRQPVKLTGYFIKPGDTRGSVPAVVFMHACDGLVNTRTGRVRPRYATLANRLRNAGMAVLMVDSFNPRGFEEICTTPPKARTIDEPTRPQDAYGALKYLRGRSDVTPDKIAVVGWGAAGILQAIDKNSAQLSAVDNRGFSAAVAFYPNCTSFSPYAPTLVLVGEKDTYNPPHACLAAAEKRAKEAASLEVKVYPDAYHSFDAPDMPLTQRTDFPGKGPVTVGTNPDARADAHRRVQAFLTKHLGISGVSATASESAK
jgi:dienelactone hydrolase